MKKLIATVGLAASIFTASQATGAYAATYTVKSGDCLSKIAKSHHVTVTQLKTSNHLSGDVIRTGDRLTIPAGVNSSTPPTIYKIKSGDCLSKIAKSHHTSVKALKSLNHIKGSRIFVGETLKLPNHPSSTSVTKTTTNKVNKSVLASASSHDFPYSKPYTVQPGDSLWKISLKLGSPITEIKKANHMSGNFLVVGKHLNIPHRFTHTEKSLLQHLVSAEAKGEPYAGQVAVATVILNRIDSSKFPDTLKGVVNQKTGKHYAFTPVKNGTIKKAPTKSTIKAVNEAIAMHDSYKKGGSLYYYNPKIITNSWILSQPVTTVIGHTVFAK